MLHVKTIIGMRLPTAHCLQMMRAWTHPDDEVRDRPLAVGALYLLDQQIATDLE